MQVSTWLGDIAFHLLLFCLQTLVAIVQSMQVSRWLWDFAFHLLLFWLQTLVAIDSGSYQRLFPSFCVPQNEVAVLFLWKLSSGPFLGHVVNLDLLLCTRLYLEHADLFLCVDFAQRPMNVWENKLSTESNFGLLQVIAKSIYIPFLIKKLSSLPIKKFLITAQNFQSIKSIFTVELSQISKSDGTFSQF